MSYLYLDKIFFWNSKEKKEGFSKKFTDIVEREKIEKNGGQIGVWVSGIIKI